MSMSVLEARVQRELRKAAAARQIQCPVTGQILDYRTVVTIESTTTGKTLAVLSPDGWRQRREVLTAAHDAGRYNIAVDNAPADAPFEPRDPADA